jgi:hypothetical protein
LYIVNFNDSNPPYLSAPWRKYPNAVDPKPCSKTPGPSSLTSVAPF